jgi:hypothetical protein
LKHSLVFSPVGADRAARSHSKLCRYGPGLWRKE